MQLSPQAAFTQYLNVVNRALGQHRNEMPYEQILDLGDKALDDKQIGVAIYKDDPSSPHGWFTVTFEDGTFNLVKSEKPEDADLKWMVKRDHVDNVIENPKTFVDAPWKLDLDWLKSTIGLN